MNCEILSLSSSKRQQQVTRMYWRRASIQDGQAFTSAWWRHYSETIFFRDNFVIFRRRSKRISFLESVIFFVRANFQFSWWLSDHFSAPFRGLYLPNAWSQTLQTSTRHTFRVSAFHQYHWFGVKLFSVGSVRRIVEGYPKTRKMLILGSGSAHATKFRNLSR